MTEVRCPKCGKVVAERRAKDGLLRSVRSEGHSKEPTIYLLYAVYHCNELVAAVPGWDTESTEMIFA